MWEKIVTQKAFRHCWNLLLKGHHSGTSRKKTNIEKILNIENKLHLQISLLLGAVCSLHCQDWILLWAHLADPRSNFISGRWTLSEHWARSRFRPVSSAPEMGPFIKCGGGGVLQPMPSPSTSPPLFMQFTIGPALTFPRPSLSSKSFPSHIFTVPPLQPQAECFPETCDVFLSLRLSVGDCFEYKIYNTRKYHDLISLLGYLVVLSFNFSDYKHCWAVIGYWMSSILNCWINLCIFQVAVGNESFIAVI